MCVYMHCMTHKEHKDWGSFIWQPGRCSQRRWKTGWKTRLLLLGFLEHNEWVIVLVTAALPIQSGVSLCHFIGGVCLFWTTPWFTVMCRYESAPSRAQTVTVPLRRVKAAETRRYWVMAIDSTAGKTNLGPFASSIKIRLNRWLKQFDISEGHAGLVQTENTSGHLL